MFVGLHVLMAERTATPELAISMEEGKQFMASAQNVMRHYSVETTQKTLDWIALFGTATGIYLPRIVGISMRRRMEASGAPPVRMTRPTPGPQPAPPAAPVIVPDAAFMGEAAE